MDSSFLPLLVVIPMASAFLIPLLSLLLLGMLWLLELPLAAVPAAIGTAVLTLGIWLATVSTGRLGTVYK